MKQIDKALRRIRILYYVFIAAFIIDIGYGLYAGDWQSFVEGFKSGQEAARAEHEDFTYTITSGIIEKHKRVTPDYIIPVGEGGTSEVEITDTHHEIVLKLSDGEKPSTGYTIFKVFFMLFAVVSGIWALVLTFKVIIRIGYSIIKKDVFNARIIRTCRRYAIIIAVFAVTHGLLDFVEGWMISGYLHGTEWEFTLRFPFNLSMLSSAVLVYMFSEVLRIGNILQQEQELTI